MTDENEKEDFDFYRKLAMLEYEFRKLRKKTTTHKVDLRNYDAAEPTKKLKELRHSIRQEYFAMSRDELLKSTRDSLTGAADDFMMDMKGDFIAIIAEADQKNSRQKREEFLRSEFNYLLYFPPQHLAILHMEVATYLADGGNLPDECIAWFAQNVIEPKRIQRPRGRNSKKRLHDKLRHQIHFLNTSAGLTIKEAQELITECYAVSESHLRDIWNAQGRSRQRSEKGARMAKRAAAKSRALRADLSKKSV
tara:strand:+ start:69 stop:821 length:753 start_codon:yes stop_codon:yes gene_type:complete